jgi:drug/metabolite transporter (DMT)-like permease
MWGRAVWPSPLQWVLLGAVGVVTLVAQVFLTRGLHLERAGRAMSISYVQVVFAALWGIAFFGEIPDAAGVAGAVLVFAGTLLVASKNHGGGAPLSTPRP